jgi:hypothetical protein
MTSYEEQDVVSAASTSTGREGCCYLWQCPQHPHAPIREDTTWWFELGFRRIPAKSAAPPPSPSFGVWRWRRKKSPPPPTPHHHHPPPLRTRPPNPGSSTRKPIFRALALSLNAFVTRAPKKKHHQILLDGSAVVTPLKTGYERDNRVITVV